MKVDLNFKNQLVLFLYFYQNFRGILVILPYDFYFCHALTQPSLYLILHLY